MCTLANSDDPDEMPHNQDSHYSKTCLKQLLKKGQNKDLNDKC